ncbi:DUF4214 domain-containing protein [Massilia sp. RP-1-19]|uniref:DUF4214 domain-containing protein n=1 Tax=Massilia polaris TaxID=2728846 RepID=A0A848HFI1_9BURK|nr:DUF4214 domain-containing protein [Massilia polaris]NML60616.1 DUF4214 domain-containing protein [Massilia polaris]
MPKLSDIENTPLSPLVHINALLDEGPDWNFLTPGSNTILYTFSVASGNEVRSGTPVTGQQAFSISQQMNARGAMDYISSLTGIVFQETSDGASAHVHLANIDIASATTVGLCSWSVSYRSNSVTGDLVSYAAEAYVYLDNREFAAINASLNPGSTGYETLLHELGHMLGLKHPHEDQIQLSPAQNNTANTLMSYEHLGGPYASFNSLDVAALDWLYGRDGLGGGLGINSATGARYLSGTMFSEAITGTQFNDTLRGDRGNDMLNGGEGTDTAVFSGLRASYAFNVAGDTLVVSGADGSDTLASIELFQFADGTFMRSQIVDTTAPVAPLASVSKNVNGYIAGNTPVVFGTAEANSTITILNGTNAVATGKADINGLFAIPVSSIGNGSYTFTATATDAAGNRSAATSLTFKVDATPPTAPTVAFQPASTNGNQPVFSGTGEIGTTIKLVNTGGEIIGQTQVDSGGKWAISPNPLGNGNYSVSVRSFDAADNVTSAATSVGFTINSTLNRTGSAGNDMLSGTSGNDALTGMAGIDTAVYAGARGTYTVAPSSNGFTISSATDGRDSLLGVERIQFSDGALALDIEGNGGMAYRLYTAIFARDPDLAGVGYWINALDEGISLDDVATGFLTSPEFLDRFGANLSTQAYVEKLYENVLHRPLDQAGFDFWVAAIDQQGAPRSEILAAFSESNENHAQVIGTIQNGIIYIPWEG